MSENHHSKPIFDFSAYSWKDGKRIQVLQAHAKQADALLNDPVTLLNVGAFDAAIEKLERVTDEFEAAIARVLVDVPREWLVTGAPDDLDWHDPESLNWLIGSKMRELQQAMMDASRPEEVSGNSARRSS